METLKEIGWAAAGFFVWGIFLLSFAVMFVSFGVGLLLLATACGLLLVLPD